MTFDFRTMLCAAIALAASPAAAAGLPRSPILDMGSVGNMRTEVERLYGDAVRTSTTKEIIQGDDSRFLWASEAKVACGIALGYLKTRTVDEESINKCGEASRLMLIMPQTEPTTTAENVPTPSPAPTTECPALPVVIFFDWASAEPPATAGGTVGMLAGSMAKCGWNGFRLTGKADKSGPDDFNMRLSDRRARNIAAMLSAAGVPSTSLSVVAKGEAEPAVETADGVREPVNRRVDIDSLSAN